MWAVRLGARSEGEKGSLTLTRTHLVFRAEETPTDLRIPLAEIFKAKTVMGSPVLIVQHRDRLGKVDTAFYFSQPPPLPPPRGAAARVEEGSEWEISRPRPFAAAGRIRSRRRARARGISSLAAWNKLKKREVRMWRDRIRAAAADAGRPASD